MSKYYNIEVSLISKKKHKATLFYLDCLTLMSDECEMPNFRYCWFLHGIKDKNERLKKRGLTDLYTLEGFLKKNNLEIDLSGAYLISLNEFSKTLNEICCDVLLCPPSTTEYYAAYYEKTQNHFKGTNQIDFKNCFRKNAISSSDEKTTIDDLYNGMEFNDSLLTSELKKFLIIDDVFASGKTVSVIMSKIIEKHPNPAEVSFTIFCPLFLEQKKSSENLTYFKILNP